MTDSEAAFHRRVVGDQLRLGVAKLDRRLEYRLGPWAHGHDPDLRAARYREPDTGAPFGVVEGSPQLGEPIAHCEVVGMVGGVADPENDRLIGVDRTEPADFSGALA